MRLMSGKPCPGAGGLAGRGPHGGLVFALAWDGDAFLLKGFSLQVRLLLAGDVSVARGLGVARGGRGGGGCLGALTPELRLV